MNKITKYPWIIWDKLNKYKKTMTLYEMGRKRRPATAWRNMDNIWNLQFGKRKRQESIPSRAFSRDGYLINQGIISDVRYGRRTTRETGCGWIACYNFLHSMGRTEDPLEVAHEMERMLLWGGFRGSHPLSLWIFLRRRGYRFRIAFTRYGTERILRRWNKRKTDGQKAAGVIAYRHRSGSHFAAFVEQTEEERLAAGNCEKTSVERTSAGGKTVERKTAVESSAAEKTDMAAPAAAKSRERGETQRRRDGMYRFLNVVYGREYTVWTMKEFFRDRVTFPICFSLLCEKPVNMEKRTVRR